MNKRFLFGLLAAAAVPTVIWASDQNINLTANSAPFCQFTGGVTPTGAYTNMTQVSTSASVTNFTIDSPTNSSGQVIPATFQFTIPATCNAASRVQLASTNGGLKDTTSPTPIVSGPFRNVIHYTADARWLGPPPAGGATALDTSLGETLSTPAAASSGPLSGSVRVTFNAANNGSDILVAGNYWETLRLTIEPQ